MAKIIFILQRKSGLTREECVQAWSGVQHTSVVKQLPGLIRWVQNCVVNAPDQPVCDGVGEMWFASDEAMGEAFFAGNGGGCRGRQAFSRYGTNRHGHGHRADRRRLIIRPEGADRRETPRACGWLTADPSGFRRACQRAAPIPPPGLCPRGFALTSVASLARISHQSDPRARSSGRFVCDVGTRHACGWRRPRDRLRSSARVLRSPLGLGGVLRKRRLAAHASSWEPRACEPRRSETPFRSGRTGGGERDLDPARGDFHQSADLQQLQPDRAAGCGGKLRVSKAD